MGTEEPRRSFWFSFGLERLGLVALKAPYVSAALIVVLTAVAIVGVSRIQVDDSLTELFRTDTEEFRQYEDIARRFPSSEYDVLVVVEGKDLLKASQLTVFGELTTELQLIEGVAGLVSMLSARDKPDETGYAPPLVPDEIPEGTDFEAMLERLKTNDIVEGKFLSDDGELALIVIALDREIVRERTPREVIGEINSTTASFLKDTGLTSKLTGAPVMQLEIRNAVERDQLIYNGLGLLFGIGIAYLFFRRVSLTIIAVAGPTIAILWTLGMIGAMDFRLNLFINVICVGRHRSRPSCAPRRA
jgi:predicted RND superfamily exporter protein